jgi:hypothetical protein
MFPQAAYSSVIRQYQDFQMLSKAQKRVTDWVLFFFFMLFILAMVFWFIIATKFSDVWFLGPIPVFTLGYFYFFRSRRKRVYELFENWFMTPEDENETATITVQTLREVALFRIRDVEKRLAEFRKMEKEDQRRMAPEMVVQCMEVFGAECASILKQRIDDAAQPFEEETESDT